MKSKHSHEVPVQQFVVEADLNIQTRRAQAVHGGLADAIRSVCVASSSILACYLLDAKTSGTNELGLVIAITLDIETADMANIAAQFQLALKRFPEVARNTVITSSAQFVADYAGSEFYSRNENGCNY